MLKGLFLKISRNAARKDMEKFLAYLQCGTDDEMAMMLCSTGLAIKGLRIGDVIRRPFPEDVFSGEAAVDAETSVELSLYISEMNVVRKHIAGVEDQRQQLFASGLGVLVQTFRALQHPELFVLGRSFWKELQRGAEGFNETMMAINPDLDESDLPSLRPVPNMLAPD